MRRFLAEPPLPLSPKHRTFCQAYVLDRKGSKAAIAANYSPRSARLQAHRLLRREDVRAYVATLESELEGQRAESAATPDVTPAWIVEKYRAIAAVSAADFVTPDENGIPRWKTPNELTADQKAAVCEIRTERPRKGDNQQGVKITGYKLYSAKDATDALARIKGLHRETVTHEHSLDVRGVFQFVAGSPATSETVARLRAKHGNGGARVSDVPVTEPPVSKNSDK